MRKVIVTTSLIYFALRKNTFIIASLMIAFVFVLSIASCKKDEANSTSSNPIVGKWKMSAYIHNGVDVYGTGVPTCVTDDITIFSNTNLVTNDEGLTKCNASDPQTLSGTYTINSNQTQLDLTINGSTESYSILILNSTTLKLQQLSNNDAITFTKQP
jgi:hypothetical protein